MKFVSAEQVTCSAENSQQLIDLNQFYPHILLATAGCIGAGLDCSDVYSVCRIVFPSSIIDMVQELGRCGCGRASLNGGYTYNFYLKLNLDDFVHLNQRLYLPQPKSVNYSITILSALDTIAMQQSSLLELLQLVVLKGGCWHNHIEKI